MSLIRRSRTRRLAMVVAVGAAAVSTVSWIAIADAATGGSEPVALAAPVAVPYQYAAAVDDSQQAISVESATALIGRVSAGTGLSDVISARIGNATGAGATAGDWFYVTVRVRDVDRGGAILPLWEADLVQGVLADGLTTTDDTASGIAGSSIQGVLPDGSTISLGGASDIRAHQVFHRSTPEAERAATAKAAADTIEKFGLSAVAIEVLQPRDDALYVVAKVPVGRTFRHLQNLQSALLGSPIRYEGLYLEVQDATGRRIAVLNAAFRDGSGGQWIDPAVADTIGGPPHG